jgi:iron complex transport system substrate-binding protein
MRRLLTVFALLIMAQGVFAADYQLMSKGKVVEKFPEYPSKVVVMDYSSLDTMEELGLENVVIAVPKGHLPNYLERFRSEKYTDVGGVMEFDIEKIYKLSPDLIIISNRQARLHEKLSKIAPTVNINIDSSKYIDSFRANTMLLGHIWGKEAEASELMKEFDNALERLKDSVGSQSGRGLITLYNNGKFSVYGKGSRFGIIHDEFEVKPADENIQVSTHGWSVNSEYIAKLNPDYLFIIDRNSVVTGKDADRSEIENVLIRTTNAYKNGRIVYLPADYWYLANGGMKSLLLMIQDIDTAVNG